VCVTGAMFYGPVPEDAVRTQAARCMDCGFHSVRAIRAVQCEMSSPNVERPRAARRLARRARVAACDNTIFRSFTVACVPRPASRRACSGWERARRDPDIEQTICGFVGSMKGGWCRVHRGACRGSSCRDRIRPRGPRGPQQLRRAGHALWCSRGMSASAGCFAKEFPSSSWRNRCSISVLR